MTSRAQPESTVGSRIIAVKDRLPPAERRVAEVILLDLETVAFGTVAEVASAARTSGPTVVRLAARIGFSGFAALQDAIRSEVGQRLRPATERIRERPVHDAVGRTLAADLENVHATLEAVEPEAFRHAIDLLSSRSRSVAVLSGEATRGVAEIFAADLGLLRPGVELVTGSEVRVSRTLALLSADDVLVAIDLRRYERWVLAAIQPARNRGVRIVAVTDSAISPLAAEADATFVVSAASPGPFDSHVGTLSLANALVAGVAARLRPSATIRLDRVEQAWRAAGALDD
ncbi:MAG: MurR/RpiR family transcriptional regulator [Acidimicrobiales bacterium]